MYERDSAATQWATPVHRGSLFVLGRFECPPGAAAWNEENWIGDRAHVVFPRTAVVIKRRGAELVSDPNLAMLYDAGETYSRERIDPRGDLCFYAELNDELIADVLPGRGRGLGFPDSTPIDARTYALQWRAIRCYESSEVDDLELEEGVLCVLSAVFETIASTQARDRRGDRRIVERAKRVLNETIEQPLTLAGIASLVHVSPYYLTRLFHRHTGMPLHRYRTELRLRVALGKLEERPRSLKQVAAATGFSSHSHFTASFRRTFGFTPVEWRANRLHPCRMLEQFAGR
jgi:AraC-like DNA-binding protein